MGFLRAILILVLAYLGARLLGRLFAPRSPGGRRSPGRGRNNDSRKEGEVRIEYTDKQKARKRKEDTAGGEYVDYEELD